MSRGYTPFKKPKVNRHEPSTTMPIEYFQSKGLIAISGVYYEFYIEKKFEDSTTTVTGLKRPEDGVFVGASTPEHMRVVRAIKETFKGVI